MSDIRVEIEAFSKTAPGGRAISLRRKRIHSFPHGSFSLIR